MKVKTNIKSGTAVESVLIDLARAVLCGAK